MSFWDWNTYWYLYLTFGVAHANLWLWLAKGIRRCGAPNTWGWGNGGCGF